MNAWMSMERDATGVCPECLEPVARWADACPCVERKEAEATRLEEAAIQRMTLGFDPAAPGPHKVVLTLVTPTMRGLADQLNHAWDAEQRRLAAGLAEEALRDMKALSSSLAGASL